LGDQGGNWETKGVFGKPRWYLGDQGVFEKIELKIMFKNYRI
jgi:hypothetical protein